jgi:AcrR family transcriptional regulator
MHQMSIGTDRLRCIVYCSTQSIPMTESALATLVARAAARNSNQAVTGQLIYMNPHFLQLLEGPEDAVEKLYSVIQQDPRHHNVRLLLRRDVAGRACPDWAMAIAPAGEAKWPESHRAATAATDWHFGDMEDLWDEPLPEGVGTYLRRPMQQERARGTVERIFRTARQLLISGGAASLTVPSIIREAAVTEPTFYRYFNGIDDLLRAAVRRMAARRIADWTTAMESIQFQSDAHLADVVAGLGTQSFMRLRNAPPSLVHAVLPHVAAAMPQLTRQLGCSVMAAMQRCHLPGADMVDETALAALLSALMGGAISVMASGEPQRIRTEQSRRMAAAMFLAGLRAGAAAQ